MTLWMFLRSATQRTVTYLEDERLPLSKFFLSFLCIIFIRDFLECFSQIINYLDMPAELAGIVLHFSLFYIALAIQITLLLHYATRVSVNQVLRVVLPAFAVLWISPLLDLAFSAGHGVSLTYLRPELTAQQLMVSFVTLLGGVSAVSAGVRCEIALALIAVFCYLRVKQLSIIESLIYTLLTYAIIYLFAAAPIFIHAFLGWIGLTFQYSNALMCHFYLLFIALTGALLAYLAAPSQAALLIREIPFLRVMYYELMLLLGVTLALSRSAYAVWPQFFFFQSIPADVCLVMIAVCCACVYAMIVNNMEDVAIDQISNPDRLMLRRQIGVQHYQRIGDIFLIIAMIYAALVSAASWLIITVVMGVYYLYSSPPFRFKRALLLSKLGISFNSLALVVLGYVLVHQGLEGFPWAVYPIILIGYTLSANFIDLKDMKGDKASGIVTLPLWMGEKTSRWFMGLASWLTSLSFYFLAPNPLFFPVMVAAGGIQCYLVVREPYQEKPLLLFYNLCMVIFIVYLFAMKIYLD